MPSIVMILAAHNEEQLLNSTVAEILRDGPAYGIKGIIIAENGSTDRTLQICRELAALPTVPVKVSFVTIPAGDFGQAHAAGLREGLRLYAEPTIFLMSAADLPFGFSDVASFKRLDNSALSLAIGSKAHPESIIDRSFLRQFMSGFFRYLRWPLLGMSFGDTQGTLFVPYVAAVKVLPQVQRFGFFFTTEFIFRAFRAGFEIVEVPVTLREDKRPTKVRILKTALKLLGETFELAIRARVLARFNQGSVPSADDQLQPASAPSRLEDAGQLRKPKYK